MMTFHLAVEFLIAVVNALYCRDPSMVRFGSLRAARHAGGAGFASGWYTIEKRLRMRCGIRGAKSSLPPFSHTCAVGSAALGSTFTSDARRLRNDRSSRTNTWRFLPQRKVR